MGREAAIVFTGEGAKVCVADVDVALAEETVSLCSGEAFALARERRGRGRRRAHVRRDRRALRRYRRPLQQRRHLARRRRVRPRHERRGVAARPGRQHEGRLPLLQARDPVPARAWGRVGDQRRVVRRDPRRRDLADLVHGVEGRRAGDAEGARRPVRARRACASTRSAPGRWRRRSCSRSSATIPAAFARRQVHWPTGRLGKPREIVNAALFLASDESSFVNARRSWSTAASPPPTSRR